MFWTSKYRKDPRVTSDRVPPDWFMDELHKLDPYLQVEWWNVGINEQIGPSFRLIRMLPNGLWAPVDWFKICSMNYIRYLRSIDQHRDQADADSDRVRQEVWNAYKQEEVSRQQLIDEDYGQLADDFADDVCRHKDRFYSHAK